MEKKEEGIYVVTPLKEKRDKLITFEENKGIF